MKQTFIIHNISHVGTVQEICWQDVLAVLQNWRDVLHKDEKVTFEADWMVEMSIKTSGYYKLYFYKLYLSLTSTKGAIYKSYNSEFETFCKVSPEQEQQQQQQQQQQEQQEQQQLTNS